MPESAKRRKAAKKILEYITEQQKQEHPKDIKADVMQYCQRESICSEPVAHSVIIDLVNKHKLKELKDKPNSQTHHLVINDEDEFTKLNNEIDKLYSLATNLTKVVTRKSNLMDKIRTRPSERAAGGTVYDTDFRNLVHITQIHLYMRMIAASSKIHRDIKFADDREFLYLRLVQVLTASNKLNQVIEPEVRRGVKETFNKMKKMFVVKGSLWANIMDEIIKTMKESH
ncbi:MAG: hypothetical protein WB612_05775 [Nitrososphaeraceae archaeon]